MNERSSEAAKIAMDAEKSESKTDLTKMGPTELRDSSRSRKGYEHLGKDQWRVSGKVEPKPKTPELEVIEGGKKSYYDSIFLNEEERQKALQELERDETELGEDYKMIFDTVLNKVPTLEQLKEKSGTARVSLNSEQFDTLLSGGKIKRKELEQMAFIDNTKPRLNEGETAEADLALFKAEGQKDIKLSAKQLDYLKNKISSENDPNKRAELEKSFEKLVDTYVTEEAKSKLKQLSELRGQITDKQLSQEFQLINLEKTLNKASLTDQKQEVSPTQFVAIQEAILSKYEINQANSLIRKAESLLDVKSYASLDEEEKEQKVLKLKEVMALASASGKKQRITIENYEQLVDAVTQEAKNPEEMIEGIENLDKIVEAYDPEEEAWKKIAAKKVGDTLAVAKYFNKPREVTPKECQAFLEKIRDEKGDQGVYDILPELRKYLRVRNIYRPEEIRSEVQKERSKTIEKVSPSTEEKKDSIKEIKPEKEVEQDIFEITPEYEDTSRSEDDELKKEANNSILEFINQPENSDILGFNAEEFKGDERRFHDSASAFKEKYQTHPDMLGSITKFRLKYGMVITKRERQMKADLQSYEEAKKAYENKIKTMLDRTPDAINKNEAYHKLLESGKIL